MVAHIFNIFNPSTWEADTSRSVSSRPAGASMSRDGERITGRVRVNGKHVGPYRYSC